MRGQPDRRVPRHQAVPARAAGGSATEPSGEMTKGGVTLFTKSAALEFARQVIPHPGQLNAPRHNRHDMGDQVLSFTRKPWRLALFENVASATRHRRGFCYAGHSNHL